MKIRYVVSGNPDFRILKEAKDLIEKGEIIAFPTDTNWVIAVSPFSVKGVNFLYKVKKASKYKHFSVLCNNIAQAAEYALIESWAFKLIKRVVPGAYTFIFAAHNKLPRPIRQYKEIGIRIPDAPFANHLVSFLGHPLITSSISGESMNMDYLTPLYGDLIANHLAYVSLVLDPGEFELIGSSSVIDFNQDKGRTNILRKGSGDVSIF